MQVQFKGKWVRWLLVGAGVWFALQYLLPLSLPFILGALLAWASEPLVAFSQRRFRWKRLWASGIGVTVTLLTVVALLTAVGTLLFRQLGDLARKAPQIGATVGQGLVAMEDFLVSLADRAPENVRPALIQTVMDGFQNGSSIVSGVTEKIPGFLTKTVTGLSKGLLTVGTGILAGFMLSVRLPRIKGWIHSRLPARLKEQILPSLRNVRKTFGRWLLAQAKLMGITFLVLSVGLFLLGVTDWLLFSFLIALVDAVPILGTGTVLIPWALVELLQNHHWQAIGLLAVYGACWVVRNILEPRLIGKSLGIDPLLSLAVCYVGFRLWGFMGVICAPVVTALVYSFLRQRRNTQTRELFKKF